MQKKILFLMILCVVFLPAENFSQTPNPTPPIAEDKDVVKITTNLIQIDATVTDKKGNIVTDLKPEDFEIYENKVKQPITNFSFTSTTIPEPANSPGSKIDNGKNLIPLPSIKLKPEQVKRTYAIIVDDLGLSFETNYVVKQAVRKFIKEDIQEGDLVAIIRTSGGIGTLQSFTSDKRQLLAAAGKIRWVLNSTPTGTFDPIRTEAAERSTETEKGINTDVFLEGVRAFRQNVVSSGKLGALRYIINGMRDLPGRKSVMLISEGFSVLSGASRRDQSIFGSIGDITGADAAIADQIQILAELANRSSIVIYPIDPRGLVYTGSTAEDERAMSANEQFRREFSLRRSQDGLIYLAQRTGGIPYVNQNFVDAGLRKAIKDQSGYYLLGYQPNEETFDAEKSRFNNLVVKIKNPDLRVRYRAGFFNVTDEQIKETKPNSERQLYTALTSPFGTDDINLDIYSIFYNVGKNQNFIRSFVRIDMNDLKAAKNSEGLYQGNYELVAVAFGDNGTIVDKIGRSYEFQLDEKLYQQFLSTGYIHNLSLPIKRPGAFQVRVALRDKNTGKVGSASQFTEVPNIAKKNLALSNLIIKNYSLAEWKKLSAKEQGVTNSESTNFYLDTTTRQFKRGTMVAYSYVIYNARPESLQKNQIQIQTRLFYNGKMLMQSQPVPYNRPLQKDLSQIEVSDAITLGSDLEPGDYVLQIVVSDGASGKARLAAQSIDFEIIG